ncbi:MAG: hypothetical protein HRU18_03135 [Pseudoalteromonas sp.]|uniref:hypothetical protein n=1 Tax=Pseudoalteromonas sp. TaxID=53249 RepID=UPI001D904FEE|nr:hypothetical protein [Pseudoalteromonas sp.]NRA77179.1 hypothetical protein [Pseudoalteromonas sp.]
MLNFNQGKGSAKSRAEAIERGMPVFFTGEPCRNGHVGYRSTATKRCKTCVSTRTSKALGRNDVEVKRRLDAHFEPEPYKETWDE